MATPVPNTYDQGDMVSMNANFKNKLKQLADPTTVVLKVRMPDETQVTFSAIKDSVGVYHYDMSTDLTSPSGRWEYRFEGTGVVTSVEEGAFFLRQSEFV